MKLLNDNNSFGALAKIFHWTTAIAFILAYVVVYYVIWFMDDSKPESWPVLNIHWVLGIIVGVISIPRLILKIFNKQPDQPSGRKIEHLMASGAHWMLYFLLLALPITGYLGTGAPTDFGLFTSPGFNETSLFSWISQKYAITWEEFEHPIDLVHHFIGKWVAWVVVVLHVAAAIYHHVVKKDDVLIRMLPGIFKTQKR